MKAKANRILAILKQNIRKIVTLSSMLFCIILFNQETHAVYRVTMKDGYRHHVFYPHQHENLYSYFQKFYWRGNQIDLNKEERKEFLKHDFLEKKTFKGVNRALLRKYFEEDIAPLVNEQGTGATLTLKENGRIEFSNDVFLTRKLDVDLAAHMLELALKENVNEMELPVIEQYPKLHIDQKLKDMGIDNIVSIGTSDFSDSSRFRIQNITNAISKFQGLIVNPGETFSFNKYLGNVDRYNGFVKELVIKPEGLTKEYGGGVCQVSTTLYRSVMKGGLEIAQRRNHSFAVFHYEPQGSDATIYLGVQDFKFTNNYDKPLAIQGVTKGDIAYFILYGGVKETRKVKLFGPYISNYRNIPADVKQFTKYLKDGQRSLVQRGQKGYDSYWFRVVDGVVEQIRSTYKAIPTIWKVGTG